MGAQRAGGLSNGKPRRLGAFVTVGQAALLLGQSRATLYRAIRRGDFPLPVVTFNGRLRIPRRSVERLVAGEDVCDPQSGAGSRLCPTCGAPEWSPARRRPTCSAARRSSSSTPSV
jgi:predicted DNA-binding transcriptional regulator AlpA